MNLFFSRNTQLGIASCVFLLFFLWVAFPAGYFFLNDDFIHIPLAGSGSLFNRSFIRPVSDMTLYVDHLLWQKNATGYHITNIVLHLLSTVSLFVLASKLFRRFSPVQGFDARPWLAAIMFLVNGCQTESVFWIIGRGGSLAGLFGMLSLICYFNKEKAGWWLVLSFVCFIVGMFAYESVLALPVIVTIFYIGERIAGKSSKAGVYAVIGFWAICILYFVYRMSVGALLNSYEEGAFSGFKVLELFFNFHRLAARSFIPPGSKDFLMVVYVLTMLLAAAAAGGYIKKVKPPLLLKLLFFCMLAAVLPFITLGADTHDSESGRFVYFSSAFACICIAECLQQLVPNRNWRVAIASLLLLMHSWFFFSTARDYRIAGQVVRQSLDCLQNAEGTAYMVNMPTQYKGALIFRSGLQEAIQWFNNKKVQVSIAHSKEIKHARRLSCEARSGFGFSGNVDVRGRPWELSITLKPGEILYYWTDSTIVRIQP